MNLELDLIHQIVMGSVCWVKSNEFGQDKKEFDHKYSLWAGMFLNFGLHFRLGILTTLQLSHMFQEQAQPLCMDSRHPEIDILWEKLTCNNQTIKSRIYLKKKNVTWKHINVAVSTGTL